MKKLPAASSTSPTLEQRGEAWFLSIENREYRVTGLEKTVGSDGLKIGLRVQMGERFHLDQVDLNPRRGASPGSSNAPRKKRASPPICSSVTWAGCCSQWNRRRCS